MMMYVNSMAMYNYRIDSLIPCPRKVVARSESQKSHVYVSMTENQIIGGVLCTNGHKEWDPRCGLTCLTLCFELLPVFNLEGQERPSEIL